jgi:hypothetical protein
LTVSRDGSNRQILLRVVNVQQNLALTAFETPIECVSAKTKHFLNFATTAERLAEPLSDSLIASTLPDKGLRHFGTAFVNDDVKPFKPISQH